MSTQIYNVEEGSSRPVAALIYGYAKAGKTSMAGTFPGPILFVVPQLERGTSSLREVVDRMNAGRDPKFPRHRIDYTPVNSIADMEEACDYIKENYETSGWRTIVLDPFTTYGALVELELRRQWEGAKDQRGMWGQVRTHLLNVWNALQGLPLHTVFVMHVKDGEDSAGMQRLEPQLVGSSLGFICSNVDVIGYMERRDVQVKDANGEYAYDENGLPKTAVQRCVWVRCPSGKNPQFLAGSRFENQLVEGCYTPYWTSFAKRLAGVVKAD